MNPLAWSINACTRALLAAKAVSAVTFWLLPWVVSAWATWAVITAPPKATPAAKDCFNFFLVLVLICAFSAAIRWSSICAIVLALSLTASLAEWTKPTLASSSWPFLPKRKFLGSCFVSLSLYNLLCLLTCIDIIPHKLYLTLTWRQTMILQLHYKLNFAQGKPKNLSI